MNAKRYEQLESTYTPNTSWNLATYLAILWPLCRHFHVHNYNILVLILDYTKNAYKFQIVQEIYVNTRKTSADAVSHYHVLKFDKSVGNDNTFSS